MSVHQELSKMSLFPQSLKDCEEESLLEKRTFYFVEDIVGFREKSNERESKK